MAVYSELRDRVVAVTGGAQGIGAETVRAFAEQGARVALVDIDQPGAERIAQEIVSAGGRAAVFAANVTEEASVNDAIGRIAAEFGQLDIVVNCAGGWTVLADVEHMAVDEWDRTVALNLRSAFLVCRAAIPHLKRSGAGRIINVASISGRTIHTSTSPAYAAAKAAVIQLTRILAYQLGPTNVTANSIAPVLTLTPRVAALRSEEDVARIVSQIPLRRPAVPTDHTQAMLFLASDAAAYITGVTLDVNGGRIMM